VPPERGGADQNRISFFDGVHQFIGRGELTIEAVHTNAGAVHALGQGIRDRCRVAIGAGE
jgi:hypothetical protein